MADHPIQEEFVYGSRTSFRKDTIRYILRVIKENDPFPGWRFFTRLTYKNQGTLAGESSEPDPAFLRNLQFPEV